MDVADEVTQDRRERRRFSGKLALLLVAGGVLLGSIVSAAAQDATPAPEAKPGQMGGAGGPHGMNDVIVYDHRLGGTMRSESVFPGENSGPVRTVRSDWGTLDAIDGSTLTIVEADGTRVQVSVDDATALRRDGNEAKLADLKKGDRVHAMRVRDGDAAYTTEGVMAISAERWAQMERQREACKTDPSSCPRHGRAGPRGGARPGGFGGPGPLGDVHPAAEPSTQTGV